MFHIFLDIDGVLVTTKQLYSKKRHEEWNCYSFDPKCVKVFNEILDNISNPKIILSSDWKLQYDLNTLNEIFKFNGVREPIVSVTPNLWGVRYKKLDELEECRANEILKFVEDNEIKNWLAIDDLDLTDFISDDNFVHCPRINEGIKQSGLREKILNKINLNSI